MTPLEASNYFIKFVTNKFWYSKTRKAVQRQSLKNKRNQSSSANLGKKISLPPLELVLHPIYDILEICYPPPYKFEVHTKVFVWMLNKIHLKEGSKGFLVRCRDIWRAKKFRLVKINTLT